MWLMHENVHPLFWRTGYEMPRLGTSSDSDGDNGWRGETSNQNQKQKQSVNAKCNGNIGVMLLKAVMSARYEGC
ncbi:uncharacterized protein PHALS_06549 [Plasmopara halstedii]|uniref:Uncharacterized protein n=1 Tax=Plasmopara halstedii TaxID=4781 RepID=A0A0P1B223_PLAHL|nr:uncharacterized protein PHALS_06549 [Plasmopara halstedii]CEG48743.1 hypothetical protein PHALS_06549 [Plasmopara halstedii]|eukprot:XP_024585112.1 hypothetical protein PHALS_06549 [Plasmopara halstedii]